MYGQICGNMCLIHRNAKRSKSGQSRNRRSTMPDNYVVFISLILKARNPSLPSKALASWKFRCLQQCLVKLHFAEVAGKPAALLKNTRQNTLVLLKLRNQWESEWKELLTDIMMITLQEKAWTDYVITILCTHFFPWLSNEKYQMQKQQWRNNVKNLRKYRLLRRIYWTKITTITDDSRKSHGHYFKTTGMRRTSCRRSIRWHPGQNGRCTDVIENSKRQNVQIFGYVYQNTNGQNHGPVWKTQLFFLNEICTVILWQDCYGKGNLRKFS